MKSILMKSSMIFLCLLLLSGATMSQPAVNIDNKKLSAGFFQGRRDALRQMMPPNSVFVVFASPVRTFSGDVKYIFHQNPDLFYFSGYLEPNSMMYIFKESQSVEGISYPINEVLFTPESDPEMVTFTGKKMGPEEAMKDLGIQLAVGTSKYSTFPVDLSNFKVIILDRIPADSRGDQNSQGSLSGLINTFCKKAEITDNTDNLSIMVSNFIVDFKNDRQHREFIQQGKAYFSSQSNKVTLDPLLTRYFDSADSLTRVRIQDSIINKRINYLYFNRFTSALRQIKTEEEIAIIKRAIEITCSGHREVMRAATPEMSEREIEAIHEFMYKKGGAKETGFPLIIASGDNGCILHYEDNDAERVGNNLVLMDVGAMYGGYSADVTRTIPANGKFSTEQLAIYNIVLEAQDSAFLQCKAGTPYFNLDMAGMKVITAGLKKLGIIEDPVQVSVYYTHGISHPIGLDVHDKFIYGSPLTNGMTITLEPGIYIPVGSKCDKKWWGIAVRIEDDILINNNDPVNLSLSAPRKAQDIEKLMKGSSPFNQIKNY
jgi:Xaa-Pro aminopeptidase